MIWPIPVKKVILFIGLITAFIGVIAQQSSDTNIYKKKTVNQKQFIPKQGAEIGFFLPVNFFRGDFNGNSVLIGENVRSPHFPKHPIVEIFGS
jgi:hypothetical protein